MSYPNILMTDVKIPANVLAAVATVTGPDVFVPNTKGMTLVVVTANRASTGTFTPKLQMKLPAIADIGGNAYKDPRQAYADGSTYVDLWTAAAAINSNTTTVYQLNQNAAANVSGILESKLLLFPPSLRWVFTYGGAGAFDITAYQFTHPEG